MKKSTLLVTLFTLCALFTNAQNTDSLKKEIEQLQNSNENMDHRIDQLAKMIDDILWSNKVGDIAHVDKLYIYGPPKWKEENPTAKGAGNPVKFWTYVFIPSNIDLSKKYPLIVLPHGGVHSDFTTYYAHIVRELISEGYVIVAPEYRGSTGYGKGHYEKIDYGGLETEDVYYSRNYMIENYSFIDKNRVGIIGWSHGGLITLMNIFDHPDDYQVAFAGVPVSDLIARMGYHKQSYRDLYEADYHIGKSANDNVQEYRRRSPVWNTHKFDGTPLLIHTNTNDDDVNVLEVEHLIKSLKAEGKPFEYKIFKDLPGGHSFDRMDTKIAKKIRLTIHQHLAKYLKPENPIKTLEDLQKAAYKF
ncbi:alpha/beta hydrolase family protein [Maribellus maritimus]|uniref:alpha/beta hydrolase family protein n=1 Tax=Maribellus maritimus TaxID=2870838 RepID=UPI001EEC913D|nr:prolyl oligopeptidase family serine peptidase [Maribellus maritimus]MCG6185759.1 prolyl oligopeptidase family serine peptidase [Maribellus maritimus]